MPWIVCKCGHDMEIEGVEAQCPICGWMCKDISTWSEESSPSKLDMPLHYKQP